MIYWNWSPIAFSIGPLQIRWYGIVYAFGFMLGYFVLKYAAKHKILENMTPQLAEDYILQLMMASIIFARLFHVIFYDPIYYFHNLMEIPAVWHGGLSIHGGLFGAILLSWYFCKKHKINFYKLADLLVIPLALVFVFGKIANYANAELYGKPTDVPWCVIFPGVDGCRHPVQIYEAIYSFFIFWILFAMYYSKKFTQGVTFWTYMLLYGSFRFLVNFYREPEPSEPVLFGISMGQMLSLVLVIVALWWFYSMKKTKHPLVH